MALSQAEINERLERMHRLEAQAQQVRKETGTTIAHARVLVQERS